MIVDVRTYNIAPRKMASYLELFEQYALPVQRKYIGEPLGYFVTVSGTLNQVVHLWGFESLAALMANCDLVITITNMTSQFSGAIGSKTWVIVPVYTQWNWFHERNDSLWYPNVQLFRQQQYGKWEDVIDSLYYEIKNIGINKTNL